MIAEADLQRMTENPLRGFKANSGGRSVKIYRMPCGGFLKVFGARLPCVALESADRKAAGAVGMRLSFGGWCRPIMKAYP